MSGRRAMPAASRRRWISGCVGTGASPSLEELESERGDPRGAPRLPGPACWPPSSGGFCGEGWGAARGLRGD